MCVAVALLLLAAPRSMCAGVCPARSLSHPPPHTHTRTHSPPRLACLAPAAGKFDWVLLRGCQVSSKAIGNHDYSASDHKWLLVDVHIDQQG